MTEKRPIFSVFAVSRTGNRGAVSMLESAIDHLTAAPHCGTVHVFTVYPKQDRSAPPRPNVHLHNGAPFSLAFKLIPLCLLYRVVRALGVATSPACWGTAMQALLESDLVIAAGGTTFSDAQLFKVVYNMACLLPAIILRKRSMMYSQTIGPFRNPFNRLCARFCLSRVSLVAPRGRGSFDCVEGLGIKNAVQLADSAFTIEVAQEAHETITGKYNDLLAGKTVVGISINTIVQRKCEQRGIKHNAIWAEFITYLQEKGYFVVMIPHSMRLDTRSRHNNDLVTVQDILRLLPSTENIHTVTEPYDCKELRVLVGLADYYVACRFHSMISAICTETPVAVFGWGYQKYQEVLADFEIEEYGHDAAELSVHALVTAFERIVAEAEQIKSRIRKNLPAVRASSMKNHLEAFRLATTP